jgi:F0F1-type ATP synthase delta subunit
MNVFYLVLIQIATFAALIVGMRLLFYRNLNSALQRLKALHEEEQIKEAQLKEELERAKQERFSEVEKGRKEAKDILETAKREAENIRMKSQETAKSSAEEILKSGREEVERLKAGLSSEVEGRALEYCLEMIKYAFTDKAREAIQHYLVSEIIEEFKLIPAEQLPKSVTKVKVTSCFPLKDSDKEMINRSLAEKTGAQFSLEVFEDRSLLTGLFIEVGSLVIDGSLKNKLVKVIPYVKNAFRQEPETTKV